jgi:aldehyde dehydrogenase family 7 protein A1
MVEQELSHAKYPFLAELGIQADNLGVYKRGQWVGNGPTHTAVNPHDNKPIARVKMGSSDDYKDCIEAMQEEKDRWMMLPAPARGEIVRQIGVALRAKKDALGCLVALEMGKVKSEGDGEV